MYQLAVFIHLAGAIIWIGGSLFLALALIPVLRKFGPMTGEGLLPAGLLEAVAKRFRIISWTCIILMVATGLYILPTRYGIGFSEFFSLSGHFGATLQLKVGLVAVAIWLSFMHDFILGPYTNRQIAAVNAGEPQPRTLPALRKTVVWIARVNVLITIIIVALAVTMTRGNPG